MSRNASLRRYFLLALSGVLTLELLAVAVIQLGTLRQIDRERTEQRRAALRKLDDPGLIVVPVPDDPIKLLASHDA